MKLVKFYQYNYYNLCFKIHLRVCMLVDLATYFFYTLLLTAQICKDPKVMGSNGLHVFHKPHNGHKYWFTQEANTESSLV